MNERTPSGWKVLAGTDGSLGSRRAIDAAARLPWPDRTELRVVTVVDSRSELPETGAAHRQNAVAALEAAAATLAKTTRPVSKAVLEGAPAKALLEEASRWNAAAIVVGARGLGKIAGLALGSVSAAVTRAAQCDVVVIKRDPASLRLLVAVDGSEHATAAARKLAALRGNGAPVTILRVIEPQSVRSLPLLPTKTANLVRAEIATATRELEREARAEVDGLAAEFKREGWSATGVVKAGVPIREIKAMAEKFRATLVGIGARGSTGLERLLLGSVSEALIATPNLSLFIGR